MFCANLGFSLTLAGGTWSLPNRLPEKVNQARKQKNRSTERCCVGRSGEDNNRFLGGIYLHVSDVIRTGSKSYRSFFGVGDGVGLGDAGVDDPVAISPSFAPAASTSFAVISSLLKGAIATTLQTRGISASDAKGAFNQTSFDIAVTIKPILGSSCSGSVLNSKPSFRMAC